MALYDIEAKKRLGYKDKRSKVRFSGEEILFGEDWKRRKKELWDRCRGQCEQMFPAPADNNPLSTRYTRCKNEAHDPHHIAPRSKGRNDAIWNLLALCRTCHRQIDKRKVRFGEGRGAGV